MNFLNVHLYLQRNKLIYFFLFLIEKGNSYLENIYQRNNLSVVHHLMFNVTEFSPDERLQEAELKLWALVRCSPENVLGTFTVNLLKIFV